MLFISLSKFIFFPKGFSASILFSASLKKRLSSELKIISSSLSSSLGIGIFDVNGLPNTDGSATFPGNPDTSIMASAATILPSSAFGLDTAVKIAEADEIGFTIKYPALQVINLNFHYQKLRVET